MTVMDLPDLVREALNGEEPRSGVNLGDEDAVCFTPTRTLVYRGEGLLSDERVAEYPHDFDRLAVSEGRRKSTFTLTYVDDERQFGVPSDRTGPVLERLLENGLRVSGVIDEAEDVAGVYRFSELTLVVTDARLVKHVGNVAWDGDFEEYPYEAVTGLDFEDGSVATQIVLEVGDRTERIKAPNDGAGALRRTLTEALFARYGVDSLAELDEALSPDDEGTESEPEPETDPEDGIGLDSGIDPLVDASGERRADAGDRSTGRNGGAGRAESGSRANGGQGRAEGRPAATGDSSGGRGQADRSRSAGGADADRRPGAGADAGTDGRRGGADAGRAPTDADVAAIRRELAELTETVRRQNEQLERQGQLVRQLIEELRRGR